MNVKHVALYKDWIHRGSGHSDQGFIQTGFRSRCLQYTSTDIWSWSRESSWHDKIQHRVYFMIYVLKLALAHTCLWSIVALFHTMTPLSSVSKWLIVNLVVLPHTTVGFGEYRVFKFCFDTVLVFTSLRELNSLLSTLRSDTRLATTYYTVLVSNKHETPMLFTPAFFNVF